MSQQVSVETGKSDYWRNNEVSEVDGKKEGETPYIKKRQKKMVTKAEIVYEY